MTDNQPSDLLVPERSSGWGIFRIVRPAWWGVALIGIATLFFTSTLGALNVYVYDQILLACMGAIALQLLLGTAGLVSIGNSAFLLVGAFSAVFALRSGIAFPFDLIFATVISGVAGLIASLPSLRIRSLFLALSTLAVYYLAVFFGNLYQVHGGPVASAAGFQIPTLFASQGLAGSGRDWAWFLFGCLAITILGASRLMRERSGRAFRMIRDHEFIAPTLGIPVFRYKLTVFVITSMVIGFEGALMAHFSGIISTDSFTVTLAFQYIAMIVIGGLDSIVGAIIGAVIVIGLPTWVPILIGPLVGSTNATIDGPNIALIIYGVLVILFVVSSPDGTVGLLRTLRRFTLRIGRRLRRQEVSP
jgi:branched-chain amino acid transport system permease protein